MVNDNDTITLPRNVVEQALLALRIDDLALVRESVVALGTALQQPHIKDSLTTQPQVDRKALRDEMWEKAMKLVSEATKLEREACAITAWSAGMDTHNAARGIPCDAREVGSKVAKAIRARSAV